MKLAILGGSFNPIHLGHLHLALSAYKEFSYDRIALVPAYISPFKTFCNEIKTSDRLKMISLAIADRPYIYCELYEIERQGVSYTIDTINYLYKKFSNIEGKIGLIIGDDLKENFSLWKNSEELIEKTDIIIGRRNKAGNLNCCLQNKAFPFKELNNEILNISSSRIRELISKREDFTSLVSKEVYSYIKENGLYKKIKDEFN